MTRGGRSFTRASLEAEGFQGWVTFAELEAELGTHVPAEGGIYLVVLEGGAAVEYLDANPGGRFKGRDPTVSAEDLRSNWTEGAEVVYIGKADNLRRRLREFMRFGQGARSATGAAG
jgi:hypothetical protein